MALLLAAAAVLGAGALLARSEVPEVADKTDVHPTLTPLTPRIRAKLRFQGAGAFDLDADGSAVWIAAHDGREAFKTRLLRIDPVRNRVQEAGVRLGAHTPAEVEADSDFVWIGADELIKIDASSHRVLVKTRVPSRGLALGHGAVWTAFSRIDPDTGRAIEDFPKPSGDVVMVTDTAVWVGNWEGPSEIVRVDPNTSETSKVTREGYWFNDFTADGQDLWAAWSPRETNGGLGDEVIARIDGESGEETGDPVTIPQVQVVADMTMAAGRLWVAAYDYKNTLLYQIDPVVHELIGKPLALSGTAVRLTPFANSLWISDLDRNVITRIDLIQCPEPDCDEKNKGSSGASDPCPVGIEGDGLEQSGEPSPPKPYFYPFNLWRTRVGSRCIVVQAGRQAKYDAGLDREKGSRRRGALLLSDFRENFTLRDMAELFSPLPAPIRIVDVHGKGMKSELILQSLEDCSLASFRLRSREFGPAAGNYACPAEASAGHEKQTWVIADPGR